MPDGRHVLRPGAGPQPVFDLPVPPHGVCEQLGVERQGGQIETLSQSDAAVALDLGLDDGDCAQTWKSGLIGKSAVRDEPVDVVADPMTADLDAAVIGG